MALIGQAASTIIGPITLAALPRGLAMMLPQVAPVGFITPNVLADSVMARSSLHEPKTSDMVNDLLG